MKKWMLALLVTVIALVIVGITMSNGPTDSPDEADSFKKAWNPEETNAATTPEGNAIEGSKPSSADQKTPPAAALTTPPRATGGIASDGPPTSDSTNTALAGTTAQAAATGTNPSANSQNSEPAPTGTLSREQIQEVVGQMKPGVKRCYTSLLASFPEADGTVQLAFTIVTEDGLSHIDLEQATEFSSLQDGEMHECMLGELNSQTFPLPEGGNGSVKVTYPFNFTREGAAKK